MEYVEIKRVGFDLAACDVKPGPDVELLWEVQLASSTWSILGYLHWDRHEGKETSRAPRWNFTRADGRQWKSFTGRKASVESEGGLTTAEFQELERVKSRMLNELKVRKSQLLDARTLIDWDAEERWQTFHIRAKREYRHGNELLHLREQIEKGRGARPEQPEWQPHVAISQVDMKGQPLKRGCDSFEWCLINLTRDTRVAPRKRRKVEKSEPADENSEDEIEIDEMDQDKENVKQCVKPVSALLKDEDVAKREIEEFGPLWKELEMLDETAKAFTTDELASLWRVAIARARVTDDGQLPFLCLDLVKQHVSRSNFALVRLLCVIHAAKAAGNQKHIRDFIRTFIKSLIRELLDQIFTEQGQLLSLTRWRDQDRRSAYKALRGRTAVEVATGFAVLCGPETAQIIAELFKAEDLKRPTVAAVAFGALLAAESQDICKVFPLLTEMLRPGAADLLLQISLYSLLKSLQHEEVHQALQQLEVPKLPTTADELRKLPSLPQLLAAWNPVPGDEPLVPAEVLKELRSNAQDQNLFTAILGCYGRHAQLGRVSADSGTAAKQGLLFLLLHYRKQSELVWKKNVTKDVIDCLSVAIPANPVEVLRCLRVAFGMSDGRWPSIGDLGESPNFGNFGTLSGMKFSCFFEADRRKTAKWIINKSRFGAKNDQVQQFTGWALPFFTGDSKNFLLKLPNPPTADERMRGTMEKQLELRLAYANQICEALVQLFRKLSNPPPEIYGLCAFTELHSALLGICTEKRSSCGQFLRHLAPDAAESNGHPLNTLLAAVKTIWPNKEDLSARKMLDWVIASFARDLHKLMLWLQSWRATGERQAAERIKRLWCVACLADRHLNGHWAPLPHCPEDFKLEFNPLRHRSWPGSSDSLDDKTWASRPLSALLAYKDVPGPIKSWDALLGALEEPGHARSWGAFAEALSGSDCQDWIRMRRWRHALLQGLGPGLEQKHLRAAIFSRLNSVNRIVMRHQQKRSQQPMLQQMLHETLKDADFICGAMEEYRALCISEPWAKATKDANEEALWNFRALLYFRNACQGMAMDLREAGMASRQLRNLGRGLYKLSSWLEIEAQEPSMPEQTANAFREAANDLVITAELPGIRWEEIAPPEEAEDGCFARIPHTFDEIYSHLMTTRAPSVYVSKDEAI